MTLDAAPRRRTLQFRTPQDILDECTRLAAGPHRRLGQWTLAQNIDHLARAADCFYEGFGFEASWWMRMLVGPLFRRRFLTAAMPPGFKLSPQQAAVMAPPPDVSLDAALAHIRRAVERMIRQPPTQPHPVFGVMSQEEVQQLACRHAELHLSFIEPTDE